MGEKGEVVVELGGGLGGAGGELGAEDDGFGGEGGGGCV